MSNTNTIIEHVVKCCESRGKQLTPKRKLVLQTLMHANKALSAYDLVDHCKTHFAHNIQAMSVYRILDFLENEQFVHKIQASSKYVVCSHILRDCEHGTPQFLICSKCNRISEQIVDPKLITGLQSHAQLQGFTVNNPQLEINCVCDKCAKST